ncbi:XYPPX repeat family protein [Histomonas meleagridis]|uniref:XYPPX repeat family protein n=1 Tax=Histomonas meleagridis TaxID=135588 RepID=UPI00355AB3C4|nr:XYPPX repeat family protein [Histomonas meleagridis]KAH0799297.1 XYPPX repeat family protein [Histomonas meleagridis]
MSDNKGDPSEYPPPMEQMYNVQTSYYDPNQQQMYMEPNQTNSYDPNQPNYYDPNYYQPNQAPVYQASTNTQPTYQSSPKFGSRNNPYGYEPQVKKYKYDIYHLKITSMDVEEWNTIPNDQTKFSHYWDDHDCFTPKGFSENTKKEHKCYDIVHLIIFLLNVAATLAIFIWLMATKPERNDKHEYFNSILYKCYGCSIAISIGINMIYFLLIFGAPFVYVKLPMLTSLIFTFAASAYGLFNFGNDAIFYYIGLFFALFFGILYTMNLFSSFQFTTDVLIQVREIILYNKTILIYTFIELIISIIFSFIFCMIIFLIQYNNVNQLLYIYVAISFYWISYSLGYISSTTTTAHVSSWYFLKDTEYYEKFPTTSFKRAFTNMLGDESLCAVFMPIVQTLQKFWYANQFTQCCKNHTQECCICCSDQDCCFCILATCLKPIEFCFKWINRFSLVYCSLFGIPFKEGCRRFTELICNKHVRTLVYKNILNISSAYQWYNFMVVALLIGYTIGMVINRDDYDTKVFTVMFSFFSTMFLFLVIRFNFEGIADTFMICFMEAPDKLKASCPDLYNKLRKRYSGITPDESNNNYTDNNYNDDNVGEKL